MDLKRIDNVGIFNVVLNKVIDNTKHCQTVIGPETALEDLGLDDDERIRKLALDLTEAVPLFTDIMSSSYRSWKTVFDVYKTIVRLDREGQENMGINHSHKKGKL